MAKPGTSLEDFDSVQLTMPDVHCVPRGKVVAGDMKYTMMKEGADLDMINGAVMLGPRGDIPLHVSFFAPSFVSHNLQPCIETLTPWPWVSTEDRRVGNVLCDMYLPDGSPDLKCPRQQLKAQLDVLWKNHGLVIKTAFEYEFYIFKENTLEPLGSGQGQFCDLREWGKHQVLFSELCQTLKGMDIKVRTLHPESSPGKWEVITEPYLGIHGADVGFYVKNAIKGFFKTKGYDATFMTKPLVTDDFGNVNTLHLNHSLWKQSSPASKKGQNVFLDHNGGLSSTAKHWIAGLLTHAEALSALFLPSLNCYRFIGLPCTPSTSTWAIESRNVLIRARIQGGNAYLENRLMTGAANPYLALAGTVAAGLDGLERRLECPPPMDCKQAKEIPHTLAQALTALQEDHYLTARMGQDFVSCFVDSKREVEVKPFEQAELKTEEEKDCL